MKICRYICYSVAIFFLAILFLPLPFTTPKAMHYILGSAFGELLVFLSFGFLVLSTLSLCIWFVYSLVRDKQFNRSRFIELAYIPFALVVLILIIGTFNRTPPSERIYLLNKEKAPEDFVNPYLGFKMVDCRDLTDQYDVVFVPGSLSIETEYLTFAPKRKDKTIVYIPGRKYGDDWYWEFSGSQWDRRLFDCVKRNKLPNE